MRKRISRKASAKNWKKHHKVRAVNLAIPRGGIRL